MNSLIQEQKQTIRQELKERRRTINSDRRHQAESEALKAISAIVGPYAYVMSYESFGDELSTKGLNHILEEEGKLVLPKIVHNALKIFHVTDIFKDLELSSLGILEPTSACVEVDPKEIGLVLVPGLGFDGSKHRIGYGKGHYDRFLKIVNEEAVTVGIGFREQFFAKNLPIESEDEILTTVLLF